MSAVVHAAVDIGEAIAGVAVGAVGVVTGNPFLIAAGVGLAATGVGALAAQASAQATAQQDINQVSPGGGGVPTAGSPYNPPAQSGAGGNAPGGTGPQTVPYGTDILAERAQAANLAQVAYEQQSLEQILTLKEQELTAEGAITASSAARGVKAGAGTAGIQLATQKQLGAAVVGTAVSQQALLDKSQTESNLAAYNAGLYNLSNETLGINQQLSTEESNLWLSTLTSTVQWGTSALNRFWTPGQANGGAAAGGWETGTSYVPSFYGGD